MNRLRSAGAAAPSARRRHGHGGLRFAASLRTSSTLLLLVAASLLLVLLPLTHACTSVLVGPKATKDGRSLVTHNNDCEDCDVRIGIVPEQEHKKGSECPVYPCAFQFPRFVGDDRGDMYRRDSLAQEGLKGWNAPNNTAPLGVVPQVAHTYRYVDGTYGLMNEFGLAMGESTCAAKIVAYSRAQGGDALFDISALMRLALQRCKTSRCAVELMGSLAESYGYSGAEDPVEEGTALFESAGEAVLLSDGREGWVFHILASPPLPNGRASAVWAAQKIEDDHVAVVPNQFIIESMNLSDSSRFLASRNVRQVALDAGFLKAEQDRGDEAFNFAAAFALDYQDRSGGRDAERRRWRVFSLLAPSRGFQWNQTESFPFSVRVEKPIDAHDLMAIMRDHYEGTEFDQTRGPSAGAYGNPNRYDSNHDPELKGGWFERSISIHRTSYSFVAASDAKNPRSSVVWFAHHSPHTSVYQPIFASATKLPPSFGRGTLYRLDRDSAWWAFAAVGNNAERMWGPIHAYVSERAHAIEAEEQRRVEHLLEQSGKMKEEEAVKALTEFTVNNSQTVVTAWWQLLDEISARFRDGVIVESPHPPLKQKHVFYPLEWLKSVGFFDKPPLPEPHYPPVPNLSPRAQNMHTQQTQQAQQTKQEQQASTPAPTPANSNTLVGEFEGDDNAQGRTEPQTADESQQQSQQQSQSDEEDQGESSKSQSDMSFTDRLRSRWVGVSLFTAVVLLLSCVCFLLGKSWGGRRRAEYERIGDVEEDYPTGGRPLRHHDPVQSAPRLHLTQTHH